MQANPLHPDALRSCIPALNSMSRQPLSSQPFSVLWRTALVRLPRAVPLGVLRYTSPGGPHPFVFSCPSRGKHLIPVYVFVSPKIQPEDAASIPVLIDFHGGGFFLGSCLEQAPFCAKMAKDLNCVVISVDYRMGPIDKFPAASEDAEDVLNAVLDDSAPGYKELRVAIAAKVADNIRHLQKSASRESLPQQHRDLSRESLNSSVASSQTASVDSLRPSKANSLAGSNENLAIPAVARPATSRTTSRNSLNPIRTNSYNTSSNSSNNGVAVVAKEGPRKKLSRESMKRVISRENIKRAVSRDSFRRRKHNRAHHSPLSPLSPGDEVYVDLDKSRIAISGFSSGGNLALGMGMSFSPPDVESPWPCRFPEDFPYKIPLLLYYPSVDSRQLPSERTRPPGMPTGSKFWAEVNDLLMPTYLPRDQAAHPRASPGLVDVSKALHPQARMLLVLPEYDNLAEQCEIWAKRVEAEGRGKHLRVERFPGMKHGWTQMPESWLSEEERKSRSWIFDETVAFIASLWEGSDLDSLGDIVEHENDTDHSG